MLYIGMIYTFVTLPTALVKITNGSIGMSVTLPVYEELGWHSWMILRITLCIQGIPENVFGDPPVPERREEGQEAPEGPEEVAEGEPMTPPAGLGEQPPQQPAVASQQQPQEPPQQVAAPEAPSGEEQPPQEQEGPQRPGGT